MINSAASVLPAILLLLSGGGVQQALAQDDYRSLGSASAPIEMVVYSDFECPYCRNFALAALPGLFAEFVDPGLLRLRFAFFPLAGIHPNSVATAKAAHCAGQAGRFWPYHDYLFVRQSEWSGTARPDSLWIDYANNLGIDAKSFSACLAAPATHAAIEGDLRQALATGVTGTPTVVLAGEAVAGFSSYAHLRERVRAALGAARP